jgi:xylulokinase
MKTYSLCFAPFVERNVLSYMKYILGFDLGTSSCKAVLYDESLQPVCSAGEEYATLFPHPGWAQQPAGQWWATFCKTVKACLENGGVSARDVIAVGIDTMGSIAVPIDKNGDALYDGLLWMDRRSVKECDIIDKKLGRRLFEITGNINDPSNIAPKVLWFKENHPEVYEKTYSFLHGNGYLVFKLTGVASIDKTNCPLSSLYDINAGKWSEEISGELGIDISKLPDIYECHDVVGKVTAAAARESGLMEGIPVVAGAMDNLASALGSASVMPGDVYIVGGTVTSVGIVADGPKAHEALHIHHHMIPGRFICVSAVDFGGGGLRWLRDIAGAEDYNEINRLAGLASPGNHGLIFLPYMVGQRSPLYNNNTKGVVFGLTPEHGREHLARMFMEGTSYAVRNILDYFRRAGSTPVSAKLTGGIAGSPVWTQIMCDIIGIDIEIPGAYDVATLGAAIPAAIAAGVCDSYEDAANCQKTHKRLSVNEEHRGTYDKAFSLFKNVLDHSMDSYAFIARE